MSAANYNKYKTDSSGFTLWSTKLVGRDFFDVGFGASLLFHFPQTCVRRALF